MLITKTPFRISFFGGATDYPEYFTKYGGAVLGTAIDKFCYFFLTPFYSKLFDYSIRLAYRQVECVKRLDEINHAPFRECLRWCGIAEDIEVDYTAELPSFSGLGTSSSFVVGLLNALYAYQGKSVRPIDLAYQAIKIERDVLKEAVGCQDQVFAAAGGFDVVEFRAIDDIVIHRIPLSRQRLEEFETHLLLVYTGLQRRANDIATKLVKKTDDNHVYLKRMREMVDEGYSIMSGSQDLTEFGLLLDEAWRLKRKLDSAISNNALDTIYDRGREAGALGGKLLGAGGGGFFLFFVPPEKKVSICKTLNLVEIPVKVNAPGTHIIHT